jgi:hypothetical protein
MCIKQEFRARIHEIEIGEAQFSSYALSVILSSLVKNNINLTWIFFVKQTSEKSIYSHITKYSQVRTLYR